jgi:hypothetical protein
MGAARRCGSIDTVLDVERVDFVSVPTRDPARDRQFYADVPGGADVGELLRWPGVPAMFSLRDPDGNGLEIVEEG